MKKILQFTLLFCFAALATQAQNVTITSGSVQDNQFPTGSGLEVLGSDATGYYMISTTGPITDQETNIERYLPEMEWIKYVAVKGAIGTTIDSKMHRQTLLLDGKALTFHDHWLKADAACYNSVIPYDFDGNVLPEVVLDKQPAAGYLKTPNFKIVLSPDGSKLMVLAEPIHEKDTKEKMRIKVFSTSGFQQLWSKDVTLETESERNPDNYICVDNKGTAFVFKHVKLEAKVHLYELIIAGKDGVKTSKIDLETFFPTDFKMVIGSDGALLIGATLATHGQHGGNWERTWALKANEGGIVFSKVMPLSQTVLRSRLSDKLAAVPNAKLADMKLRAVLPRTSGGFYLLAESYTSTKATVGASTPPVYESTLVFGDICVVAIDGDGKEIWTNVVAKKQTERTMDEERYFGSFVCHSLNDKLYIVWNLMNWEGSPGAARFVTDKSGAKVNIDNLFGQMAMYPTMLTTINGDGSFEYKDRPLASLPLLDLQKGNKATMAPDGSMFFPKEDGMVLISRTPGARLVNFRMSRIKF